MAEAQEFVPSGFEGTHVVSSNCSFLFLPLIILNHPSSP